ncbi:MAG TPA: XopAJ/AvrRxo1 family type III secretion system effector zeta toxin [Myxococcus sp.]|nr:XopAJ/AvrRxo1 family type III secretion system effector zeta toxin [Myxococcus sp.]
MGVDGIGGGRRAQSSTPTQQAEAPKPPPPPPPAPPKPPEPASRFDPTKARTGPALNSSATSLLTENSHDGKANCLDQAADWLEKATPALRGRSELVFLKDTRPGAEGQTGHVVVRQGDRIVDPSSGKSYDNLQSFLKDKPQYQAAGTIPGSAAARIFSAAPGSPERQKAIADAKIPASLQNMMVADGGPAPAPARTQPAAAPAAPQAPVAPQAPAAPQRPPYTQAQAAKDAAALHDAMEGGVTGWGTDEDKVFKTLEGKTPDEVNKLRQAYKDHYRKDLDATVRKELGGDDLKRAEALLKGNAARNDAVVIQSEMGSLFGSSEKALKTLEGKTPAERHAIAQQYADLNGGTKPGQTPEDFMLSKLTPGLNAEQAARARNLLGASQARTPQQAATLEVEALKAGLKRDMDGLGTDEDRIFERLEKATPEQRKAIAQDKALVDRLKGELGTEDFNRAMGLIQGTPGQADAARVTQAMNGFFGADEKGVREVLQGKTPDELKAIKAEYARQNDGRSLEADVRKWGGADADVTLRLLNPPAAGDKKAQAEAAAERLHLAMDGLGTDEAAIREVLKGKSKTDIDAIAAAYSDKYKKDLRATIDGELDGRDELEILKQDFDLGAVDPGAPNAAAETARRLREVQQNESGFGTWVLDKAQRTIKGGESDNDRLDRTLGETEQAVKSGNTERANTVVNYATEDVKSLQSSKDSLADGAASAAVVVTTTAAVIATGGAATPLAIAGYAALGAATRTGTYYALQGDAAGAQELGRQALIGAAEGGTAVIPVGKGGTAAVAGTTALRETAQTSIKAATLQGIKEGAVGGAVGGAVDAATRSETWENGVVSGLGQVGFRAVVDGTVGAATGGVAGAGTAAAGQVFRKATGASGFEVKGDSVRFTASNGRVYEGVITPDNAKEVLDFVKQADVAGGHSASTYKVREAILERSGGNVSTMDAFTKGAPPKDGNVWDWMADPANWVPERQAVQKKLFDAELAKAQALSDRMGEPNTVYALRGNTAAGKTTTVKGDPELKAKVLDGKGEISGALNPDPIKAQLVEVQGGGISTSQAHMEGSAISQRVEQEMLSRPNSSLVYDKRFAGKTDIPRLLEGIGDRKLKLIDLDVPLETSSVRVLMRNPGTADPLVPFGAIAQGFEGVRTHRQSLIDEVRKNPQITDYKLFVADETGKQVLVAEKKAGKWMGPDTDAKQRLYERAIVGDAATETARVKNTVIDDAFIERQVSGISSPDFAAKMRARLTEYKGKTLGQALDDHSKRVE